MVLRYIKRYILVLLLPVIRSLLNFGTGGVISKLILGELVLSIIIIAIAVIRWKQYRIVVYNGYLRVSHGIFIKKIAVIPLNKISGLYVYKSPFYSMFGAARVTIDTDAGYKKKSDFDFYFSTKNLPYLTVAVSPCHKGIRKYNCTVWQSFALAVSNASALTGVLVFATAINYAGKIFDENVVNDTIINTITLYTAIMNKFLPPATSFVALVIFIGFAISFLLTLLKYLRFSIRKSDEGISVEQGLLIRKNSYINQKEIAAKSIECGFLRKVRDVLEPKIITIYHEDWEKYRNLLRGYYDSVEDICNKIAVELHDYMVSHIQKHLLNEYKSYNLLVAGINVLNDLIEKCIAENILTEPEKRIGPEGVLLVVEK